MDERKPVRMAVSPPPPVPARMRVCYTIDGRAHTSDLPYGEAVQLVMSMSPNDLLWTARIEG